MSIEKLDSVKVRQEKIPFTMHLNYVLQNVQHPLALAIWVYLSSLPETWHVNRNQLMEHFNVGRDKLKDALAYLNENYLIEYYQEKLPDGTFGHHEILVKSGHEFEVIHRTATAGLKNRWTEKPLDGKTASIKEISNTNKKYYKKSFCKTDQKKHNSERHAFADAMDAKAQGQRQMQREAEHIKKSDELKKTAMPQQLRDKVRVLRGTG